MDVSTTYAGLELKSPVIVAASSLTASPVSIRKCEENGAGAVVLKSLYEEQIAADKAKLDSQEDMYFWYPDAADYIDRNAREQGLGKYIQLIEEAKKSVHIPVIASINCVSAGSWTDYVQKISTAGADALELNIFIPPMDPDIPGNEIENEYLSIVQDVIDKVTIPVTLKIGFYFSNPARMMTSFDNAGIKGLVMFNRFFRPDIDIENLRIITKNVLSNPHESTLVLRWIALMSGKLKADLCATTGIHHSNDVIKQVLCGANAVQVASVLYEKGMEYILELNQGIQDWMTKMNYKYIADFKGIMTDMEENKASFERVHYIKKTLGALV